MQKAATAGVIWESRFGMDRSFLFSVLVNWDCIEAVMRVSETRFSAGGMGQPNPIKLLVGHGRNEAIWLRELVCRLEISALHRPV